VSKLLLMASMWVMILLPLRAARSRDALKGLQVAVTGSLAFNVLWAIVVLAIFLSRLDDPQSLLPPPDELDP
jgi:hypothetical protein